jgi:hypothetical protein
MSSSSGITFSEYRSNYLRLRLELLDFRDNRLAVEESGPGSAVVAAVNCRHCLRLESVVVGSGLAAFHRATAALMRARPSSTGVLFDDDRSALIGVCAPT